MKATISFTLPEERQEYMAAMSASEVQADLHDLDNELRSFVKHGTEPIGLNEHSREALAYWVRSKLANMMHET